MKRTGSEKPTLESTVNLYRKLLPSFTGALELECRFDIKYIDFLSITNYLIQNYKNLQIEDITLDQLNTEPSILMMVSAIKDNKKNNSITRRDITFHTRKNKTEEYITKKLLIMPPYRVTSDNGINYKITLSSEKKEELTLLNETAIIRAKIRLCIPLHLKSSEDPNIIFIWRIDLTVVREVIGNEVKVGLSKIIDHLFKEKTIEHFSSILVSTNLSELLYKYEIEIELVDAIKIDNVDIAAQDATKNKLFDQIRPVDILNAVDIILNIKNPEYKNESQYQDEVYNIAKYIVHQQFRLNEYRQTGTLKRLLPQVIALTKNAYSVIYPPKGFYITDKADGKRCIAIIRNGIGILMTNKMHKFIPTTTITDGDCLLDTILDGEYIESGIESDIEITNISGHFYAFDIITLTGINISVENFDKRLEYLENGVDILNRVFGANFAEVKPIYLIENNTPEYLETIIKQTYESSRPYEKDGLILIESEKPYELTSSYKWKSTKDTTIDFLVKKAPRELYGAFPYIEKKNYQMYILFVGINISDMDKLGLQILPHYTKIFKKNISERPTYIPIQFTLADVPYAYIYYHPLTGPTIDDRIVEFRCAGDCTAAGGGSILVDWEVVRIREDRTESKTYYGNHFQVAESTWSNYINPFSLNELWARSGDEYFKAVKEKRYDAMVKVINFIKGELIIALSHCNWIIDIGAGKGQDLGRYFNVGIKNLIAIDQDRAALTELIERRQSFIKQKKNEEKNKKYTSVYIIVSDINHDEPSSVVTKCNTLGMGMCNAIICNLAFHYFLGTSESINNFITIAEQTIAIDGLICITCFNGGAIHDLFIKNKIPTGESWDLREDGLLKYSLKRLYSSSKLEYCGQKIGVLLPFSMGGYYEEYLFNFDLISKEFKKRGFTVQKMETLDKSFSRFESKDHRTFSNLSENDKTYLSLFCEVVFKRVK